MKRIGNVRSRTVAIAFAAVAVAALAAPALASGPPSGFVGQWRTIDCAATGEGVDCSIWGDGSAMSMTIGPGDVPAATYQDAYATVCAVNGSSNTRWVGAGYGEYDGDHLWLTLTKSGCGTFGMGGYGGIQLYHDPGSDTIWEDEDGDGWGLIWYRAP
jgi:hypothetical protein